MCSSACLRSLISKIMNASFVKSHAFPRYSYKLGGRKGGVFCRVDDYGQRAGSKGIAFRETF